MRTANTHVTEQGVGQASQRSHEARGAGGSMSTTHQVLVSFMDMSTFEVSVSLKGHASFICSRSIYSMPSSSLDTCITSSANPHQSSDLSHTTTSRHMETEHTSS